MSILKRIAQQECDVTVKIEHILWGKWGTMYCSINFLTLRCHRAKWMTIWAASPYLQFSRPKFPSSAGCWQPKFITDSSKLPLNTDWHLYDKLNSFWRSVLTTDSVLMKWDATDEKHFVDNEILIIAHKMSAISWFLLRLAVLLILFCWNFYENLRVWNNETTHSTYILRITFTQYRKQFIFAYLKQKRKIESIVRGKFI